MRKGDAGPRAHERMPAPEACGRLAATNEGKDAGSSSNGLAPLGFSLQILIPYGTNHRYDVVVDTGGRFLRAQCKTGRLRRGVIRFSTVSTRVNAARTYITPYDAGQIDLFLIYCPETDRVYAVDLSEAASSNGRLRVDPTVNGQAKGIRWAADHELPA
jgi:PD-(D/E)XK endonuclease